MTDEEKKRVKSNIELAKQLNVMLNESQDSSIVQEFSEDLGGLTYLQEANIAAAEDGKALIHSGDEKSGVYTVSLDSGKIHFVYRSGKITEINLDKKEETY